VLFPFAHATHPDWRIAAQLVLAQLDGQKNAAAGPNKLAQYTRNATLGLLYITEAYAPHAQALLAHLKQVTGVAHWAGCSAIGVAANGAEYIDEPALAVMLCEFAPGQAQLFSGVAPLRGKFETALVHCDPAMPDVADLIGELAARTGSGYLFGGLASGRGTVVQFADDVHSGGLSGVAFSDSVAMISRVTQGSQPIAKTHTITRAERNVVYELDGQSALSVLFGELGIDEREPRRALPKLREVLVGLTAANSRSTARPGQFGDNTRVRHLIGIDAQNKGVAIADTAHLGEQLTFCTRNVVAARRDLVRICAEIRSELEPEDMALDTATLLTAELTEPHPARNIRGAIYVSCAGRGGPHFGSASAELKLVQQHLGDVPLVGFFAGGEIAHANLYGYTGVLTCFT
jgi:small ligand-binding sensory domain FIST